MRAPRGVLRWLLLVGVALATVVMHAGGSGACADHAVNGRAPTAMGTAMGHQDRTAPAPVAPASSHAVAGAVCQAPLPPQPPVVAALALVGTAAGVLARASVRRRSGHLAPQWWPPPPQPSSSCVWRI